MSKDLPRQSKTIGGHRYHVRRLPWGLWQQLYVRLQRVVGPALGRMLEGSGGGLSSLLNRDVSGLGEALGDLTQRLDHDTLEWVTTTLGTYTDVEDGRHTRTLEAPVQETWWPHHLREFAPWLAFALEVQLADFFAGLGDLGGPGDEGQDEQNDSSPSSPQTASTG